MGMQINTNVAALNSYRNLSNTQNDLSKSLEKLSSGLRINRAADDAAGLAISEGLRSQVGGLKVGGSHGLVNRQRPGQGGDAPLSFAKPKQQRRRGESKCHHEDIEQQVGTSAHTDQLSRTLGEVGHRDRYESEY